MSSWAVQPKRTLLNDANRSRFGASQPAFENNARSPGPAAYSPRKPQKQIKGLVALKPLHGATERERTLANGVIVDHVNPSVGPQSYEAEFFPKAVKPMSPRQTKRTGPRFRKPVTDAERYADITPGPGSYDTTPRMKHAENLNSSAGQWSLTPREVCEPLRRDDDMFSSDPQTAAKSFSPQSSRSTQGRSLSPRQLLAESPAPAIGQPSKPKGGQISQSPRHLNMHNLDSKTYHEHDNNYDNPAPGRYNPQAPATKNSGGTNKGKFSPSPRKLDMTHGQGVPGPGSYNLSNSNSASNNAFYPPI